MKITLFGAAATGTSTAGKLLADDLEYPFMSSGALARAEAEKLGMDIYEFDSYSAARPELDRKRDEYIAEYGRTHSKFIFDSRLAWHFIPDSFKIMLVADPEITYERVAQRENISVADAEKLTEERRVHMENRFKLVYPDLSYPPTEDIFDLIVDTSGRTAVDVVAYIKEQISDQLTEGE